jgi:hypothetical protein
MWSDGYSHRTCYNGEINNDSAKVANADPNQLASTHFEECEV